MASSQAPSSFLYEEMDDFIFHERISVYQLQLEGQREAGKYLSLRSQAGLSALSVGTSAMGNHDEKFTRMWERQETSPSEDEEEEERASFLDQLLQKRTHTGKERISPDLADKRDLAEYWEQLFVNLQRSSYQGEGITGLLLLYPTCIVHILESSTDMLYSILRDLRNMEEQRR
ncbi:hypothetical protein JD844_011751 [Phrynosoma platyrhinos]|uniref:Uncharacterized protein n=1 Tax=Phrynosoma platyrhinos TaxID=52577 RepID=A0ABQ7TIH3_PHRPL|nr:hypothetical protein JD844_011751 [Phrynosoma platyrhinos]